MLAARAGWLAHAHTVVALLDLGGDGLVAVLGVERLVLVAPALALRAVVVGARVGLEQHLRAAPVHHGAKEGGANAARYRPQEESLRVVVAHRSAAEEKHSRQ